MFKSYYQITPTEALTAETSHYHIYLLHVTISCLPHVIVLNYTPHRLPWQEVLSEVKEILAILLQSIFKKVSLSNRPFLHLITAQHRPPYTH